MFSLLSLLVLVPPLQAFERGGDEPPAEVEPFVPKGFEILDFATGDLDGDGRADVVLILKNAEEYDANADGVPRPLLLLARQADGRLKKVRRNDRLVPCRTCGGSAYDPYQGMEVGSVSLTLRFAGGRRSSWSEAYTFAYDAGKKDWFLQGEQHDSDVPEGGERRYLIAREELGDVPLEAFDRTAGTQVTKWRVVASRARFYERPDLQSSPRKAYVVKGDLVSGDRELKNFVMVTFHDGRRETFGFLLKRDLELLSSPPAK